jgi:hypothetical protein
LVSNENLISEPHTWFFHNSLIFFWPSTNRSKNCTVACNWMLQPGQIVRGSLPSSWI